jgi:hypothetical protein
MKAQTLVAIVTLLLSLGCRPARPVIDTTPGPDAAGTISGTVSASDGTIPLSARTVTAVHVMSGERFEVSTTSTGGYTLKVPPGEYRLELELREGETLSTDPESTEVGAGDLDAGRNFVVTVARP